MIFNKIKDSVFLCGIMTRGSNRFIIGVLFAIMMMLPCAAKMQAKVVSYPIANTILSQFADAYGARSKKNLAPLIVKGIGARSISNFCGMDENQPDVLVAHRRLTTSDLHPCSLNHLNDFVELELGHGGIVVLASPDLKLSNISAQELYSAISKLTYRDGRVAMNGVYTWSELSSSGYDLPAVPLKVLIPGANADLRDVFEDRILVNGCQADPKILALRAEQPKLFRDLCLGVRSDRAVDDLKQGSRAELLRMIANERGVVAFAAPDILLEPGVSQYVVAVDGHKPTYKSIRDDSYPLSSPIYMYVKLASLKSIKSLRSFLLYIFSAQNKSAHLSESAGFLSLDDTYRAQQFELVKAGWPNLRLDQTDFVDQALSFVRNARIPLPESPAEPDLPETFAGTPLDQRQAGFYNQNFDSQAPAIKPTIDDQLQNPGHEPGGLAVTFVHDDTDNLDSISDGNFDLPASEAVDVHDDNSLPAEEIPE